ncbi:hypothetical protein [Iningainema tapete]|uniref:Uncharacterized protein n=1 Tax=Iningainema tapete BLCC-T55 TaxID=2748662 RepID=A0A8J7CET1_9CYAN|nr:hypothetical protein [Iningainema tapete]MBD2773895.1 hypothetical protein [Iningainema tapete BLCC-T55]
MKCKLIKFLTVCFVTLVVFSPGILVFSFVWEQHQSLVQTQHVACEVNHSSTDITSTSQSTELELEPSKASIKKNNFDIVKLLSCLQQYQIFKIMQWIVLLFPLILVISIIVYDKYLVYRANIFQQQVEMLEKLWQHSIEQ